jgi:hypothetical protein
MKLNLATNWIQLLTFATLATIGWTSANLAGSDNPPHKCARCGSPCPTQKVCRAIAEKKKVSKTEFGCECEDFCVPGRSGFCGYDKTCDDSGCVKCTKIWEPGCAQVRSRRVLTKKNVDEEVTVYKWVVEELCDACATSCDPSEPAEKPNDEKDKKSSASLPQTWDSAENPIANSSYFAPEGAPKTTLIRSPR